MDIYEEFSYRLPCYQRDELMGKLREKRTFIIERDRGLAFVELIQKRYDKSYRIEDWVEHVVSRQIEHDLGSVWDGIKLHLTVTEVLSIRNKLVDLCLDDDGNACHNMISKNGFELITCADVDKWVEMFHISSMYDYALQAHL